MNIVATFTGKELNRIELRLAPLNVKFSSAVPAEFSDAATVVFVQGNKGKSSVVNITTVDPYAYKNDWTVDFDKKVTTQTRTSRVDTFVALVASQVKTDDRREKLIVAHKPGSSWSIGDEVFKDIGETDMLSGSYIIQSLKRPWIRKRLNCFNRELENPDNFYRFMEADEIIQYFNSLPKVVEIMFGCENSFGSRMTELQAKVEDFQTVLLKELLLKLRESIGEQVARNAEKQKRAYDFPAGGFTPRHPYENLFSNRGFDIGVVTEIREDEKGIYFEVQTSPSSFTKFRLDYEQADNTCNTENQNEKNPLPKKSDHDFARAKAVWKEIKTQFKETGLFSGELSEELRNFLYDYEEPEEPEEE